MILMSDSVTLWTEILNGRNFSSKLTLLLDFITYRRPWKREEGVVKTRWNSVYLPQKMVLEFHPPWMLMYFFLGLGPSGASFRSEHHNNAHVSALPHETLIPVKPSPLGISLHILSSNFSLDLNWWRCWGDTWDLHLQRFIFVEVAN